MLWKELVGGFVIAGYVAVLPRGFFNALLLTHGPEPLRLAENVVVGPLVAALAFVCSVGNVPLAAVLWAGGSSFAGVIAFLFADLIIVPIVGFYRKTYGGRFATFLTASMLAAIALAALAVDGLLSLVGLVPTHRPSISSIVDRPIAWGYTSVLDILFGVVFVALVALTVRRGARDPVCGMTVDRHAGPPTATYQGRTFVFCGPHCQHTFEREPEAYA
jgi:YHS domain-containing protein